MNKRIGIVKARYNKFNESEWEYSTNPKDGEMIIPEFKIFRIGRKKYTAIANNAIEGAKFTGEQIKELPPDFKKDFLKLIRVDDWPKNIEITICIVPFVSEIQKESPILNRINDLMAVDK